MELEYLPYKSEEIPASKIFSIDNTEYTYEIKKNEVFNFYTLTVKNEDNEIIYTGKIVCGNDVLHVGHIRTGIEKRIIPFDPEGKKFTLDSETFGKDIKLYVVE